MFQFKALSIRQPFSNAIMQGVKDVEWRTWDTAYRGPLIIHAGSKIEYESLPWAEEHGVKDPWVTGVFLGVAFLGATFQDDSDGLYGFVLHSPLLFPLPILGPGKLNLFHPGEHIIQAARRLIVMHYGVE